MTAAHAHDLAWVSAAPLWQARASDRAFLQRPALLRFTTDAFMEELFGELESKPEAVAERVALPAPGSALKLFQPVHGHFHLVAASLVCRLPGLPDHPVDPAREERAEFVLRRVVGDAEFAWAPGSGPSAPGAWLPVADPETVAEGEELLPLFPGAFADAGGRRRRLLFGLIPTSSRETFRAAEVTGPSKVGDDGEAVLAPAPPEGVLVPKLGSAAGALYVVRCVYRKPRCRPPERPLLSGPTERFAVASYFDPDAPARTIRIVMPTSLAGLAKMKKNVGIVVSNELRKKLAAVGPGLLKGEAGAEGDGASGEVCSMSIPALTLIAMVVMMIFAALLDLIFHWALWPIRLCVPINLKPKE